MASLLATKAVHCFTGTFYANLTDILCFTHRLPKVYAGARWMPDSLTVVSATDEWMTRFGEEGKRAELITEM